MRCCELKAERHRYTNLPDPMCRNKVVLLVGGRDGYCMLHIPKDRPPGIDLRTGKPFVYPTVQEPCGLP